MANIIKITILSIAFLFLWACDDQSNLTKDFDRANKPIVLRVFVHKNEKEVTEAYKKHLGPELKNDKYANALREGWATWSPASVQENPICDVHVVEPRSVKDKRVIETWGHELVHCIYGKYHKPGVR